MRRLVVALLLVLPLARGLPAIQNPPTAIAHVVPTPPVIDGRLNDAAWRDATPITGFIQRELHEGAPITERTEVRIITDGQALYVGAWLYDTDPSGIVPGEKVRDGDIATQRRPDGALAAISDYGADGPVGGDQTAGHRRSDFSRDAGNCVHMRYSF